jgi:hypothetical protein
MDGRDETGVFAKLSDATVVHAVEAVRVPSRVVRIMIPIWRQVYTSEIKVMEPGKIGNLVSHPEKPEDDGDGADIFPVQKNFMLFT